MKSAINKIKNTISKTFHVFPAGKVGMGVVLLMATGCSDTWDEHYNSSETGSTVSETLWQQIKSNPNLSRFASIVETARYYKDQEHPMKDNNTGKDFTYDQLLNSDQILTVWAPENEAFTEESFNQWMELAKTNGYSVQQQLVANSIALWRKNVSTGTVDTLRMLNGKIMIFDQDKKTLAGTPLNETNISAYNGTLHTTKTLLPFNYNLYEYMKDGINAKNMAITKFHEYVIDNDTTYFDENRSLEGTPDENGYPTFVDSAYQTTNSMFYGTHRNSINNPERDLTSMESFGAHIEAEDSSFIMLIPTDAAWNEAYEKLLPLYKYADNYLDNAKVDRNMAANREISEETKDSLTRQSINMDIISPLCFNVNIQPNEGGRKGTWTADKFADEQGASAKYFINTFGDTLRSDANWEKSTIFDGKKVKLSNGYGVLADHWNIPSKLYKPDVIVEVGNSRGVSTFYNKENWKNQAQDSPSYYSFSNSTQWCDSTGTVSHNNFYYVFPTNDNSKPSISFKLKGNDGENKESDVMSGRYDIKVVMVPNYYMTSNDSAIVLTVNNSGRGTGKIVDGDTIPVKHKLKATLYYINNDGLDSKGNAKQTSLTTGKDEYIDYDGTKVDTLTVFKDFVFPYSYKNLSHSYPILELTADVSAAEKKLGYSHDYCIDQIILVSKDDNTVVAVKKREE